MGIYKNKDGVMVDTHSPATLDFRNQFLEAIGKYAILHNVSFNQIARRSRITKRRLFRILDGYADFNLSEFYDIGDAIGVKFEIRLVSGKTKGPVVKPQLKYLDAGESHVLF